MELLGLMLELIETIKIELFSLLPYIETIAIAAICGALIGAEREWADKPAGLRTNILICVGACLCTMMSLEVDSGDKARIAAQVVSGVGFIGAGAIMRMGNNITGVTTAATIWLVAAIGISVGFGFFGLGLTISIFATLLLFSLGRVELWKSRDREEDITN